MSIASFVSVDASTSNFWRGVACSDPEGAFATVKMVMIRKSKKMKQENFE
jgi:hypothetical protein